MSRRFLIAVLDGFGIGAMEDVPRSRPEDAGANTAASLFKAVPDLKLPVLSRLGLGPAMAAAGGAGNPPVPGPGPAGPEACFGFHRLAHFGADTFWGHQELMGTKPLKGEQAPIASRLGAIEEALKKEGRRARRYRGPGGGADILVVEEALTIGDNLETDLGDNYNVTAALDLLPFEEVRKIGALVRSLVRSSRVIVFGGEGVGLENLLGAYRSSGAFAGVSAPDSGVYRRGYQVVHLGFGVNPDRQVPSLLARRGIETILIGKVADIVENPHGKSLSGVDTPWALEETRRQLAGLQREDRPGFLCVNVQETDLAGHRQDPALYAERLAAADRGLGELLRQMAPEDILAVTGDHGNDPLIGHPRHTREKTPLLLYGKNLKPGFIGGRETLGDTGAAALDYLAPDSEEGTEAGTSYLGEIYPRRLQGFGKP